VKLTALVTGLSPSDEAVYQFAAWGGNVVVDYGTPLQTSGEFSPESTWDWSPTPAGAHVKFTASMKVRTRDGLITKLVESEAYHIVDDARARELWSTRIGPVFTFHRCASCHNPGDSPTQGDDRHTHVPSVNRQTDCRQCHGQANGANPGSPPGAPGHWKLPPPAFSFTGKSAEQICRQIKDPSQNGGRTLEAVRDHVRTDPVVKWTWAPGPGRTPSPFSWESIAFNDNSAFLTWVRLGAACPEHPTNSALTAATSADQVCCTVTPNPSQKGRLARLVVAFPMGATPKGTRVAVLKDGKELRSGYGNQQWELLSGIYEVVISGKHVPNGPLKAGHDTNVKVGVLKISAAKETRIEILDGGTEISSGYGDQLIGLPVGSFNVLIAGQSAPVTNSEGETTDF
jgi:hypothetical protein